MRQFGLTLVELLIVIVIVAILATIAVPSYNRYVDGSNRQAAQQFMLEAMNRAEEFRLDRRMYPADLAGLDLPVPDQVSQHFTVTAAGANNVTPPTFVVTAVPLNAARHPTMTLSQNLVRTPPEAW
jgi:type IV pilus assembly protein PilE